MQGTLTSGAGWSQRRSVLETVVCETGSVRTVDAIGSTSRQPMWVGELDELLDFSLFQASELKDVDQTRLH